MSSIPASLSPFFQEYRLEDLDLERSAYTIIERSLRFGNREEIRWLFASYPRARIARWVEQFGPRCLPEPHLTFWRLVLDLSPVSR